MRLLIASIPRSGLRWLRDSIGGFHNVPWLTPKDDLHIHMRDCHRVCGHHPPFENVLALPHTKVYLRRRSAPDQITSYASHPHSMIAPEYICMHQPYTDINNAIKTMAQVYSYMEAWKEHADFIVYYEDLCGNFAEAVRPFMGHDADKLAAYSKTQTKHVNKGCDGIGQSECWTDENWATYRESFSEI